MGLGAAIFAVAGLLAPTLHADLTEEESLRGLDRVQVVVEALHADADAIDLTTEDIKSDAVAKLDAAGIALLSLDERLEDPRRPYVYINCNVIYLESLKLTSFSIDVEVHQRVTLENGQKAQGLTWAKSYLGVQSRETASTIIREVIQAFVAQFVRAATAADTAPDGPADEA